MRGFKGMLLMGGLMISAVGSLMARDAGDQGIGLVLGAPTGFTMKMWLNNKNAIDATLGVESDSLAINANFLHHDFEIFKRAGWIESQSTADLPLYIGVGPRVRFDDDTEFGVRIPVGVSLLPHQSPWEFFMEFAPVVRLTPSTGINGNFGIGARYYFDAIRPRP